MTVIVLAQKQKLGSQKYLKLQYSEHNNVQCHVFIAQAMLQQNACIQSHLRFGALIFRNLHYAVPCALVFMSFQTLRGGKQKKLLTKKKTNIVIQKLRGFCR